MVRASRVGGAPAVPGDQRAVGAEALAFGRELLRRRHLRRGRRGGRSPPRTPKSSVGHTSSRPSWNIKNMCAVHSPMPRTSTSSRTTSSSGRRATRRARPSRRSTFSARSRIDAAFAPDSPAPRRSSTGSASTASARRLAVEQRFEAPVDRGGGAARELLVADHARELGEVRAPRPAAASSGTRAAAPSAASTGRAARGTRAPFSIVGTSFFGGHAGSVWRIQRARRRHRTRRARARRPRARRATRPSTVTGGPAVGLRGHLDVRAREHGAARRSRRALRPGRACTRRGATTARRDRRPLLRAPGARPTAYAALRRVPRR